ncbi:MAG: hypothetical protein JWQ23_1215 [Herminiimonas sp.]|nr:hypothetical protein [Herminiimonas sp.]
MFLCKYELNRDIHEEHPVQTCSIESKIVCKYVYQPVNIAFMILPFPFAAGRV